MPSENLSTDNAEESFDGTHDAAESALAELLGGSSDDDVTIVDDQGVTDETNETAGAEDGDAEEEIADESSADSSADQTGKDGEVNAGEPPSDLNAEEAKAWSSLSPEAKAAWASYSTRSQASRSTVAKELDGLKKQFGPVGEAAKPYQQYLQAAGADLGTVVSALMPYYVNLTFGDENVKRQTIDFLAKQFGAARNAPQEDESEYQDPEINGLKKKIADLEAQVSKTQDHHVQLANERAQAQIDEFKSAKDENGNLKYPHCEKLEPTMVQLLSSKMASGLEDAYSKAKALDPEVQAAEAKAKAEAKRQEDAAKAAKAEKAAQANRKGDSSPAKPNGFLTTHDAAEAALRELSG